MVYISRIQILVVVSVLSWVLCGCVPQPVFDTEELDVIADSIAAQLEAQDEEPITPDTLLETVRTELQEAGYGDKVRSDVEWQIDDGDGGMNHLAILYASSTEYLTIVGSPVTNEWVYGPYDTQIFDFILDGELSIYWPGDIDADPYLPGDFAELPKGASGGYLITDYTWMLEYGRDSATTGPYAQIMFVTDEPSTLGTITAETISGLSLAIGDEFIQSYVSDWLGISSGFSLF